MASESKNGKSAREDSKKESLPIDWYLFENKMRTAMMFTSHWKILYKKTEIATCSCIITWSLCHKDLMKCQIKCLRHTNKTFEIKKLEDKLRGIEISFDESNSAFNRKIDNFDNVVKIIEEKFITCKSDIDNFDRTNQYIKRYIEKLQDLTIDFKGHINSQMVELKKSFVNTIIEVNTTIGRLLTQQDSYNHRVEKHKIYIDKVYTSNEWLAMEKRKMAKQIDELIFNTITKEEFNSLKEMYDKEIRMLRNRVYQHERDIKKIDSFIDKELPVKFNRIKSDVNERVEKSNKERDELIGNIQQKTERNKAEDLEDENEKQKLTQSQGNKSKGKI